MVRLQQAGKKFVHPAWNKENQFEKVRRNEPKTKKILIEKIANREIAAEWKLVAWASRAWWRYKKLEYLCSNSPDKFRTIRVGSRTGKLGERTSKCPRSDSRLAAISWLTCFSIEICVGVLNLTDSSVHWVSSWHFNHSKNQEIENPKHRSMQQNALKTLASPPHKTLRRKNGSLASTSAATEDLDLVRRTKRQPERATVESGPSVSRLERLNGGSLPHLIEGRTVSKSSRSFSSIQRLQPHGNSLLRLHSRAARLHIIDDEQKRNTTMPKPQKDDSDAKQQSR